MRSITYDDVRNFMASRTMVSSQFGNQLDRMRDGLAPGTQGNWKLGQEREEMRRLQSAALLRCVDRLYARGSIRFAWVPDIKKFAKRNHLGDGETVVKVLQAYEPWGSQWPEKGLAEAYQWLRSVEPRLRDIANDNGEPAIAFRNGTAKDARKLASSIVADAHVCLFTWVGVWSRTDGKEQSAA